MQIDASPSTLLLLSIVVGSAALAAAFLAPKPRLKQQPQPTRRQLHSLDGWMPLLGDALEYAHNGERLHEWMAETSLKLNGEPWRIHVPLPGYKSVVVITSPDLVEEVMTTKFESFPCGEYQITVLEDLMGQSIVTSDGVRWFHQRKAAVKFFTNRALRTCMTTCMRKNMSQVYDVIDASMVSHTPVDLIKLFHEFALQTFVEVGLGVDIQVIGAREAHPMEHAIEDVTPVMMRRMQLPLFWWKVERWLNLEPERTVATAMASVRGWLRPVIEDSLQAASERQQERQSSPELEEDDIKNVMELFLELSADEKEGLRSEDLVDFILTVVLGARSSTALALTWTFLMLAKHPRVEQLLREELSKACPAMGSESTYLTTEDVSKVVYLEATIKEVLRLYPPFPLYQKEAAEDTLVGEDLLIKKGELVCIQAYAMARLPSVWGPDAAEFKPERWISKETGQLIVVPSNKFVSFGSGPRICIGMRLAMLELRVVTANLLSRYNFTLATSNDCSHVVAVELMPATPVMIHATRTKTSSLCA